MIKSLDDIETLASVAKKYKISRDTLDSRLKSRNLIEGIDFKKLEGGLRMPVILSPSGVEKII